MWYLKRNGSRFAESHFQFALGNLCHHCRLLIENGSFPRLKSRQYWVCALPKRKYQYIKGPLPKLFIGKEGIETCDTRSSEKKKGKENSLFPSFFFFSSLQWTSSAS